MSEICRLGSTEPPLTDDDLVAAYSLDRSAPWLRVNFVSSLDGSVTAPDGYSAGLSSAADKRVFNLLRMLCDGLMVGAGTLRHERYDAIRLDEPRRAWRRANGLAEYLRLVIVSRSLNLDPAQAAFADAPIPPIVITTEAAMGERLDGLDSVARVIAAGENEVDLGAALDAVRAEGLGQILCEGGPHLLGSLTGEDLVDELCLTIAPLLVGPGPGRITAGLPCPVPRGLALRHVLAAGDELLLRYTRE